MKRAQVVLTTTEAKKLMCTALMEHPDVKRALKDGIVAIHPSSSTYFFKEALVPTGPDDVWVVGILGPHGACIEDRTKRRFEENKYQALSIPANFPFTWVFRKGKFETGQRLSDLLAELGPNDVYIKGVNTADIHGNVGVLLASLAGGTIGLAAAAEKKQGFKSIYLAGQEKIINADLFEVAKESGRPITSDSIGIPCGIMPIKQPAFSEITAYKMLFNVEAMPLAAGGLGGGEGNIMLILKGEDEDVEKAMAFSRSIKGAALPKVELPDCSICTSPGCPDRGKPRTYYLS